MTRGKESRVWSTRTGWSPVKNRGQGDSEAAHLFPDVASNGIAAAKQPHPSMDPWHVASTGNQLATFNTCPPAIWMRFARVLRCDGKDTEEGLMKD